MNILARLEPRAAGAALLAAFFVLGCWPVAPDTGAGGTGGAGGSAGTLTGSDIQVCAAACQKLIACGAGLDLDACKNDCAATSNAALVACFRSVDASCNPLAACTLDAICQNNGSPAGSSSCSGAGACLIQCGGNVSQTCGCDCALGASPSVASSYYNVYVCSLVHCSFECGPSGDPASCESCLGNQCNTQTQACP